MDPRITFTRSSTGTYFDDTGLIVTASADTPRFEHNPKTGECLGLLIEGAKTNYILNSNSVASWANGTFSQETTNPIKGLFTTRVTNLSTDGDSPFLSGAILPAGTYTLSHYIDTINSTCTSVTIYLFGTIGGSNTFATTNFNFSTKSVATVTYSGTGWSAGIANAVDCGNGIYRISLTATSSGATTVTRAYVIPDIANTSYVIIAGTQIENGDFATSYIPTTGSSATRSADTVSMTGTNFSSWFNPNEGTIVAHVSNRLSLKFSTIYTFDDGTGSAAEQLVDTSGSEGTTEQIFARVSSSTTGLIFANSIFLGTTIVTNPKHAYAYKNADFGVAANGTSYVLTGTSRVPTGLTNLKIGRYTAGTQYSLHGTLSQLSYYPSRLTNDQLAFLTK